MKYDYSKLLGRLKEYNLTQAKLAEKIGKNEGTVNVKLNNKSAFTSQEIDCICEVLEIPNDEIGKYFFAK